MSYTLTSAFCDWIRRIAALILPSSSSLFPPSRISFDLLLSNLLKRRFLYEMCRHIIPSDTRPHKWERSSQNTCVVSCPRPPPSCAKRAQGCPSGFLSDPFSTTPLISITLPSRSRLHHGSPHYRHFLCLPSQHSFIVCPSPSTSYHHLTLLYHMAVVDTDGIGGIAAATDIALCC